MTDQEARELLAAEYAAFGLKDHAVRVGDDDATLLERAAIRAIQRAAAPDDRLRECLEEMTHLAELLASDVPITASARAKITRARAALGPTT